MRWRRHWRLPSGGSRTTGCCRSRWVPRGCTATRPRRSPGWARSARRRGLRRRTQANEQVDVEVAAERYGARPLALLEDWGWLGTDVTLAHLCEVTDAEIERVAATGTSATHAPGCDVPMGWGVAPVARLIEAGVRVGLGTSGGGSNDAGHLLADARLAMQVSGLVGPQLPALTVLGDGDRWGSGRSGPRRPRTPAGGRSRRPLRVGRVGGGRRGGGRPRGRPAVGRSRTATAARRRGRRRRRARLPCWSPPTRGAGRRDAYPAGPSRRLTRPLDPASTRTGHARRVPDPNGLEFTQ